MGCQSLPHGMSAQAGARASVGGRGRASVDPGGGRGSVDVRGGAPRSGRYACRPSGCLLGSRKSALSAVSPASARLPGVPSWNACARMVGEAGWVGKP